MEIQQLEDLSSAARFGYWAPHLLAPDEDKVFKLGEALRQAVQRILELEGVVDMNKALEEENDYLKTDVEDLKDTLKRIREMTDRHVKDVQD